MQCGRRKGRAASVWLWELRGTLPGKLPKANDSEVQTEWFQSSSWHGRRGGRSSPGMCPAEQRDDDLKQTRDTGKVMW